MRGFIAFGSNLGDMRANIAHAVELINQYVGTIQVVSTIIETEPLLDSNNPVAGQANYLNGGILVETALAPVQVLEKLLEIEAALGRKRGITDLRWGPRTIDLDLIALEDQVVRTQNLTLPHPEMHKRDFVLIPMAELWPDWRHPLLGKNTVDLLAELPKKHGGKGSKQQHQL